MPHLNNPWCWHRSPSLLFGITVRRVDSISLMYKVVYRVGKLSQQYRHLVHLVMQYLGVPKINEVNKVEDKKID
jgi:uncharacterized tellurite resistance protein B-like protein